MSVPIALLTITTALSAMMLAIVWSLRRCGLPGVGEWCNANLTATGALVLFSLRGMIPDLLSVGVANAALAWSLTLFYAGSVRFCGGVPPWRRLLAATAVTTAGVIVWRYAVDVFTTRVVIVSVFHAVLCALIALTLLRRRPRGQSARFFITTACFALFFAAGHAVRGTLSALQWLGNPYLQESMFLNTVFLTLGALVMPAMTMGAVLMIHDAIVRRLEAVANTDTLTGVLSRKAFEEGAQRELARAAGGKPAPALLIVDIDHFKSVNDTYGHAAGDAVLQAFARLVAAQLRPGDLLGRLGGEEFMVLLPATGEAGAGAVAERIRACVQRHAVTTAAADGGTHTVRYTVSGGTAGWHPGLTLAQLSARADAALYRAKVGGRNRIAAHSGPAAATQAATETAQALDA
ncbi:GGDEF domain-containing protein [Cupriavidus sp. a3]|uniref:GGDEF domain-containing protein n=1 Tax=Cupriavidus sp. a3 TaxID=3242158 RepID=UPI003D9C5D59